MTCTIEDDLVTDFSAERVFPFIEDEHHNITGYGHQDPATFAEAVNIYDRCNTEGGFSSAWQPDDVEHGWAKPDDAEDGLTLCAEGEPGAVPVTVMWGKR